MTQCKIEFTYASHCVSKNVMPRRMLRKQKRATLKQDLHMYVSVTNFVTYIWNWFTTTSLYLELVYNDLLNCQAL